jgi:hypothetical protein
MIGPFIATWISGLTRTLSTLHGISTTQLPQRTTSMHLTQRHAITFHTAQVVAYALVYTLQSAHYSSTYRVSYGDSI